MGLPTVIFEFWSGCLEWQVLINILIKKVLQNSIWWPWGLPGFIFEVSPVCLGWQVLINTLIKKCFKKLNMSRQPHPQVLMTRVWYGIFKWDFITSHTTGFFKLPRFPSHQRSQSSAIFIPERKTKLEKGKSILLRVLSDKIRISLI